MSNLTTTQYGCALEALFRRFYGLDRADIAELLDEEQLEAFLADELAPREVVNMQAEKYDLDRVDCKSWLNPGALITEAEEQEVLVELLEPLYLH